MPTFNRRPASPKPAKPVKKLAGGFGAAADELDPYTALRRIAVTWFLFEEPFYAKAEDLYEYVKQLCALVDGELLAALAIEVRNRFQLRRMPLVLARELARHYQGQLVGDTIANVVQRVDELGDFVWLYWERGKHKQPLSKQVKLGLGRAIQKFDEYQFAKWKGSADTVNPRDVLFLVHGKPKDIDRHYTKQHRKQLQEAGLEPVGLTVIEKLYLAITRKTLAPPDTWEVSLSRGKDKKETFLRLMDERKLPDDAFIRNLRNMVEAGIDLGRLRTELKERPFKRQQPTQFMAAARHVPSLESALIERLLVRAGTIQLDGNTLLVIDTSGSMGGAMSGKSEVNRLDAACTLAMVLREQCANITIYATAGSDGTRKHQTIQVPDRKGMGLADWIRGTLHNRGAGYGHKPQPGEAPFLGGGGIFIVQCMDWISHHIGNQKFDRVIVVTDEQDCDLTSNTADKAVRLAPKQYIVNVAPEKHGVVTGGKWLRISGFSDRISEFIREQEILRFFEQQ